jgi:GPH family glycoside/pentoside/hexuronide:cation symporter
MTTDRSERLPTRTLLLYALPTAGTTSMHWLIMVFLLKFATDTLGLAPMMVGFVFGAGRFWDALSDPIAGWASDRTRSRLGRRRPWMFCAAVPLALSFYALWSVPVDASPRLMGVWLAASLLLFFTALTAVRIPYLALGAELTENHHERTRLCAVRVGAEAFGIFTAIGALHLIENAESIPQMASWVAGALGLLTTSIVVFAAIFLREPAANQGRAAAHPIAALRDVAQNPHALRLTIGLVFAEVGLGSLLVAIPFVTEMMGQPGTSALRILGFVIPFVLAVPIWIPLGERFGKSRCYVAASGLCALSFVTLGVAGFGQEFIATISMVMIGVSQAALRTFPDSIKADVIDWDEARTGERKEGSYFAVWNLADKAAGVLSVGLVGFFIQGSAGGVDVEGVRLVVSYVPAFFMTLSMITLGGFGLGAREHADLRARIASSAA